MKRLNRLTDQYRCDPKFNKQQAIRVAFQAGFLASRKMCALMGQIAVAEGKDINAEIMKVGDEEVDKNKAVNEPAPFEITGIINTLE